MGDQSCLSAGRPFAYQTAEPVESVDGASAVLCILATTTCPAFLQAWQTVPDCKTIDDDDACGVPGIDDGLCRLNNESEPFCTYPCGKNADCPLVSTSCRADGYCSF